jgi:hypothetical protein
MRLLVDRRPAPVNARPNAALRRAAGRMTYGDDSAAAASEIGRAPAITEHYDHC